MRALHRTWSACLSVCIVGMLSAVSPVAAMDKISVRMDVFFHGPHAPFFLGIEKGFYREQNIDLTVHPGSGSGTVIKLIGNKNDDFAYADGATLVKAISEGVPTRMVMGLLQSSPMVIVALKDSGISKPGDLPGKRMAGTPGSSPELMFPAFCKINRIDCTGVNSVQVDIPGKTAALLSKRVQATFVYAVTQVPMIEDQVGPINVIRYADHGVNLVSNGIVTHNETVEKKPDLVRRFVRATVKSWQHAIDHPDEAVAAFGRVSDKPKASVVSQQLRTAISLLSTPRTKGKPLGWMSGDDWRETIGFLEEYGGVPKGIASERIFTNDFLESR